MATFHRQPNFEGSDHSMHMAINGRYVTYSLEHRRFKNGNTFATRVLRWQRDGETGTPVTEQSPWYPDRLSAERSARQRESCGKWDEGGALADQNSVEDE